MTKKPEDLPDPPLRGLRPGKGPNRPPQAAPPIPNLPPIQTRAPLAIPELEHPSKTGELGPNDATRLRNLIAERALRRIDALRLYEALPVQEDFHRSDSRINILRGGNRSGKTLGAAVELARAVCGMDPFCKYSLADGRCYAVGKDLKHIGEVMWRKLSRAGAFKIIRDTHSGAWRAYRPWDERDQMRSHEAKPAPPLIPKRMIKDIAWENKKEEIPIKVTLVTGWEINFYSSLGKPPQGSDLDLCWLDEEIVDPNWFPEMAARLLDRSGRFIWSATPQAGTEVLYELHERAERERYNRPPRVREHVISLAENPHIAEADKAALAADLTDEERKVRIDGDFAIISFRVYPEFNMLVHGLDVLSISPLGVIPPEWTRYMIVDPGHQVCAVLFVAIPPKEDMVVAYDELYLRDCHSHMFAVNVAEKTKGQTIQASIIDPNMAVYTEVGIGKSVGQQYSEALDAQDFYAAGTGTGWIMGSDDTEAGVLAVHGWLRVGETGYPRFRVLKGRCPHMEDEFKRYVKQRSQGVILDKPNNRRNNHLMDCFRYLALYNPRWIKVKPGKARPSAAMSAFRKKQERRQNRQGGKFINLGPGRENYQHV